MGKSSPSRLILKIFENNGTLRVLKTYYLIEVPR
jgi:hypothetical protein